MTVTHFTGTGPFDPNGDYYWNDPTNWDNGVPQYGESAFIDGTNIPAQDPNYTVPVITMGDLGLSGLDINCRSVILDANFLTLSQTAIISVDDANSLGSALLANEVIIGGRSFVGIIANESSGNFDLVSSRITNYGIIGDESGGGSTFAINASNQNSLGLLNNNGLIVATGGGFTAIVGEDVLGKGSAVVSQGGTLLLLDSDLSNKLAMGGASASTFEFDPLNSLFNGDIHGFALTDFIHLDNFITTGLAQSGSVNPTLTLTGTDNGAHISFNLDFAGNYTHSSFNFATDAGGTGTLLYITHG